VRLNSVSKLYVVKKSGRLPSLLNESVDDRREYRPSFHNRELATKWSDFSVVKICYADVHLLCSLHKIIRGIVDLGSAVSSPAGSAAAPAHADEIEFGALALIQLYFTYLLKGEGALRARDTC